MTCLSAVKCSRLTNRYRPRPQEPWPWPWSWSCKTGLDYITGCLWSSKIDDIAVLREKNLIEDRASVNDTLIRIIIGFLQHINLYF
jgi:hypothetical protein